jgi:hypothetical protein
MEFLKILIHSFNNYLFITFYVPSTGLGLRGQGLKRHRKMPLPCWGDGHRILKYSGVRGSGRKGQGCEGHEKASGARNSIMTMMMRMDGWGGPL